MTKTFLKESQPYQMCIRNFLDFYKHFRTHVIGTNRINKPYYHCCINVSIYSNNGQVCGNTEDSNYPAVDDQPGL